MKTWLRASGLGLVAVLAGCQAQRAVNPAKARAEIEARTSAYAASLLAGPAATAAFYADDGELISGTTGYRGPQGVRAFLEPIWKAADLADPQMRSKSVEVFGDTAYQWGTYSQRAALKGQPLKEYRGSFAAQWRRGADGRWVIVRLMTNP